jgi:type IV pilus assembly protein PilM
LTDENKKRDIAATSQLLEVIRGERSSMDPVESHPEEVESRRPVPPPIPEDAEPRSPIPPPIPPLKPHVEAPTKTRGSFSLFAKRTIGLDVGSHTIKCVQVEKKGLNRVELIHAEAIEIPSVGGDHVGEDEATTTRVDAIRRIMGNFPIHKARVVTAVGGVATAIRQIELPKMSAKELSSSINLWARNYIPFDVKEVQLDYQVFGLDKSSKKIRLLLVAVIREYVKHHVEMLHRANIEPVLVDLNPLAVMNAFLFSEQTAENQSIILLDVGDRNTTLCIYSNNDPYFVRNLMISGNDFTRDIQRKLALSYADAEKVKRGGPLPSQKRDESPRPIDVVRPSLEALAKEIRRSLTYYENQTKSGGFGQIVMTGGSAQMDGFAEYLGEDLGLPVRVFDPFTQVENRDIALPGPPSQFTLALGLALRESK